MNNTVWRRDPFGQLYQPGAPCWAEIAVTDLARSETFYGAVLGWEFDPGPAGFRYYHTAYADGAQVAAMAAQQTGWSGGPVFWQLYLATRNISRTLADVKGAGGRIVMDQLSVGSAGTMVLATDTTGALFGLWDAKLRHGFSTYNDHGAVTATTHRSQDPAAARAFYDQVFGNADVAARNALTTREDLRFEQTRQQVETVYPTHRPGLGATWTLGFAVDDVGQAAAAAVEYGGRVLPRLTTDDTSGTATIVGPDGEAFDVVSTAHTEARTLQRHQQS